MKLSSQLGLAGLLLVSQPIHSANPVQGWYVGLMGGGSYSPSIDFTFLNPLTQVYTPGSITYSLGGDGGGQFGYRYNKFRFEGQLLYNMSMFDKVEAGNLVLKNHTTPDGFNMDGKTQFFAFLFNAYYELYQEGSDSNFIPYLGLGLGYASVRNNFEIRNVYFNSGNTPLIDLRETSKAPIAQFILGASYFLDDFCSVGMDFRYLSTTNISALDASVTARQLNVNFNYALDKG